MSTSELPHILVTGAAGFIAQQLIERYLQPLVAQGRIRLTLTDVQAAHDIPPGVRWVSGDLTQAALWQELMNTPVHQVFHLAAIVSGPAERDYPLGLDVNLHATQHGLDQARQQFVNGGPKVQWLFASSIAVFGIDLPRQVSDQTPVHPHLSYGTHKRMLELMIHDLSRRGELDGRCLRLSGVVVRPQAPNGALSGFNSDIIREPLQGRAFVCPVTPQACIWLCSTQSTIDQLWQLSQIPFDAWQSTVHKHRTDGVVNAPTWPVKVDALIDALGTIDPRAPALISFDPAAPLQAQFGNWPETVDFALAADLGLADDRLIHQHDLSAFVRHCIGHDAR